MKNPYKDLLEQYMDLELSYRDDFCRILNIEPKDKSSLKNKQIDFYRQYMYIETKRGIVIIKKIYENEELLFNIKRSKFTVYFENLLILYLSKIKEDVAVFTYSEIQEKLYIINNDYNKAKLKNNRDFYIYSNNWNISGNRMIYDKDEMRHELKRNVGLFFTVADKLMKEVIDNSLKSMESQSLILFNKSFRIYKKIYNPETETYFIIHKDCTPIQVDEILDIQKTVREKYNIKTSNQIYYLSKSVRHDYFNDILKCVKSNPILENYDFYGKTLHINLAKKGLEYESSKINKEFNRTMINSNVQSKLLTSKEMKCVNEILRVQMVDDLIVLK